MWSVVVLEVEEVVVVVGSVDFYVVGDGGLTENEGKNRKYRRRKPEEKETELPSKMWEEGERNERIASCFFLISRRECD